VDSCAAALPGVAASATAAIHAHAHAQLEIARPDRRY
jgi:hypothetical protein